MRKADAPAAAHLIAKPITLKTAKAFIKEHHRHHPPPVGWKFGIGCFSNDCLVGVIVAGRPVARGFDDGLTIEMTRVCTDGTKNVCSFLYSRAWRAAKAMGYCRGITYTLQSESGTSLKASNWRQDGVVKGRSWSCKSRPREDNHPLENKVRWIIEA